MARVAVHVVQLLQTVEECFVAFRGQRVDGRVEGGAEARQHLGEGRHAVGGEVRGGGVTRPVATPHGERQAAVVGRRRALRAMRECEVLLLLLLVLLLLVLLLLLLLLLQGLAEALVALRGQLAPGVEALLLVDQELQARVSRRQGAGPLRGRGGVEARALLLAEVVAQLGGGQAGGALRLGLELRGPRT